MGLSKDSTGIKAASTELVIKKVNETDHVIALAGNPNVGKSTVFNELTAESLEKKKWQNFWNRRAIPFYRKIIILDSVKSTSSPRTVNILYLWR